MRVLAPYLLAFAAVMLMFGMAIGMGKWLESRHARRHERGRWWWV